MIGEILTVVVACSILIFYFLIEPKLTGYFRSFISIIIIFLATFDGISSILAMFTKGFFYDTSDGAHLYTYLFITLLFLLSLYRTKDAFKSAAISALYVSLHESLYFFLFYLRFPEKWVSNLLGDSAFTVWMICIIIVYFWKYEATFEIAQAGCWYFIYQVYRVTTSGFNSKPEVSFEVVWEFLSWGILLFWFVLHSRRLSVYQSGTVDF